MTIKTRTALLLISAICIAALTALTGCKENETNAAQQQSNQNTPAASSEKMFDYQEIELENGMKVVTLEDFSCPIVAAQVWYKVGSKDEQPDRQGFAHMFEHMMFKGTDRVSDKDHFKFIMRVGGTNNAYTSFDNTTYIQTVPANQLELVLWLEAERMNFLKIDQSAFDTERKVVEEELRMGENRPYGTLYKKQFAAIFKKHPYQWTPIGKLSHLRAASVEELRSFWKKYYVPNNATLVIVGAVKHAEAQKLAKEYFDWIPKYDDPKPVDIKEPERTKEERIIIDDENAPAALVDMLWKTVPLGNNDEAVLDLLGSILGQGNSSRLYRELVAEKQIAVQAEAYTYNLEDDGIFSINAVQTPGSDAEDIIKVIKKQIADIADNSVKTEELEKARNKMLKGVVTQNLTIESKARLLGNSAVKLGDTSRVNTRLDEIRGVTIEDIRKAAANYLAPEKTLIVIVKENPGGKNGLTRDSEDATATAEPETQTPPQGREGTTRPANFPKKAPFADLKTFKATPKYYSKKLSNGVKVMVVENHEVPFVTVNLGMLGGAWTENKPGTASMALSMLTKGTSQYSEGELAEELEKYAISLSGSADMDTSTVNAGSLSEHIDRAIELMGQVVLEPAFDKDEFNKLRKQTITNLKIQENTPRYLASRELRKKLYGEHPYARAASGESTDLEKLSAEDLKLWWSKWARPDTATLIFAGDIDKDKAFELAEKTFGSWKIDLVEMGLVLQDIKEIQKTKIYILDMPGAAQSEIRIGGAGITRKHQPDYFISRIVSNYFGGSFNSRLNEAVRIKRGLTYGASGGYTAQNQAGSFTVGTFTKTDKTSETIEVILDEIKRLREQPPTPEVLENTKSYFAGSFTRTRETPQSVAGDLWLIESEKLGSDYLDRLLDTISKTTAEDCVDFAKRTVDPDKLVIVIVGDAEKMKPELEKIAPVTILNK